MIVQDYKVSALSWPFWKLKAIDINIILVKIICEIRNLKIWTFCYFLLITYFSSVDVRNGPRLERKISPTFRIISQGILFAKSSTIKLISI